MPAIIATSLQRANRYTQPAKPQLPDSLCATTCRHCQNRAGNTGRSINLATADWYCEISGLARVSPRSPPGSWHCRSRKDSDFSARLNDHEFQVIPTAWIEAAQERWRENGSCGPMTAIGVDVAPGGDDRTVVAARPPMGRDYFRGEVASSTLPTSPV
jgi:hypothetical protein